MRRTELNDLAAFATLADAGSFTRAAGRLGMSPSALSHAISGLRVRQGAAATRKPDGLNDARSAGGPIPALHRAARASRATARTWRSRPATCCACPLTVCGGRPKACCARSSPFSAQTWAFLTMRRLPGVALARCSPRCWHGRGVRTWCRSHLLVNPSPDQLLASELAGNEGGDASRAGPSHFGDCGRACDREPVYRGTMRKYVVFTPPRLGGH